jgi:hypothetical protein
LGSTAPVHSVLCLNPGLDFLQLNFKKEQLSQSRKGYSFGALILIINC